MKIATEYYGAIQARLKYNSQHVRHRDRRKSERRNVYQPVLMEQRFHPDRRKVWERRISLRPAWGIIHVYGSMN